MSDDADDENGEGEDVEHIARIGGQAAQALGAATVSLKLESGREITGTLAGLSIRRKDGRKGVVWSGSIRIQTEPGLLQIDCATVRSISAK